MWCSKILVAYDGSSSSRKALELAASIAVEDARIEIVVVHAVKMFLSGSAAVGMDTVVIEDSEMIESEVNAILSVLPNASCVKMLRGTSPADLILRCAEEESCDLIIMGSRGQGGVKGYLGSVSYAVVQGAAAKVLIAKDAPLGGAIA